MQPVELYPFQLWRMETRNNILYNLVGIIKLSLTFQDQNTIDVILLIITKLSHCFTFSFVFFSSLSAKWWSCQPIEVFKTVCSNKNAISYHMTKGYSSALKKLIAEGDYYLTVDCCLHVLYMSYNLYRPRFRFSVYLTTEVVNPLNFQTGMPHERIYVPKNGCHTLWSAHQELLIAGEKKFYLS